LAIQTRPILKWAGGKQSLAGFLVKNFPRKFETYYEPFVGGGSVFLHLSPDRAVIGDLNGWLLDTYRAVRDDHRRVARLLDGMENTREEFLRIRSIPPETLDLFSRAAHLIFLNKTCFRGLFRVNRTGRFNVPYGNYDRRTHDPENLAGVAVRLQRAEIRHGDFEACVRDASPRDFIYFDPPYFKLGGYADFNRYTSGQFREEDHERLAALCRDLDRRDIPWALSNSETPFVRNLFKDFPLHRIPSRREINLNAGNRDVHELLITSYPLEERSRR